MASANPVPLDSSPIPIKAFVLSALRDNSLQMESNVSLVFKEQFQQGLGRSNVLPVLPALQQIAGVQLVSLVRQDSPRLPGGLAWHVKVDQLHVVVASVNRVPPEMETPLPSLVHASHAPWDTVRLLGASV